MLNNVVLVGRVLKEPELTVYESGYRSTKVYLSVVRPFRNEKNEYETDVIPITIWYKMADVVCEYVGVGSIIGFKCRLATHSLEVESMKLIMIDVIAERVSFIHLKPRVSKANKAMEEEAFMKELQKNNFVEYDSDVFADKSDEFLDIEETVDLEDNEEKNKEKAEKGKKKAK